MEIRPVKDAELVAACRLTFPGLPWPEKAARAAIDRAPAEFGIDLRRQVVALNGVKLVGACLYVLTPGRSAIVLKPVLLDYDRAEDSRALLVTLVAQARQACQAAGAALIQALLEDAPQQYLGRVFGEAGFAFLALLEYLEAPVAKMTGSAADDSWAWESFRPEIEPAFYDVVRQSYRESRDCPALDAIRSSRDALAGHKASGLFTPENWILARRRGTPAGLVLVNRVLGRNACELVYMGVAPPFRGQGLGKWLVRKALERSRVAGCEVLTLAVDVENAPARHVYAAAGFRSVGRRYAYFVPPPERR